MRIIPLLACLAGLSAAEAPGATGAPDDHRPGHEVARAEERAELAAREQAWEQLIRAEGPGAAATAEEQRQHRLQALSEALHARVPSDELIARIAGQPATPAGEAVGRALLRGLNAAALSELSARRPPLVALWLVARLATPAEGAGREAHAGFLSLRLTDLDGTEVGFAHADLAGATAEALAGLLRDGRRHVLLVALDFTRAEPDVVAACAWSAFLQR